MVLTAGQTGVQLLPASVWKTASALRVVGDAGTCPPLGVEGMQLNDRARQDGDVQFFGGLTIGSLKLRTQRTLIARLFDSNEQIWDAAQVLELARNLHDA